MGDLWGPQGQFRFFLDFNAPPSSIEMQGFVSMLRNAATTYTSSRELLGIGEPYDHNIHLTAVDHKLNMWQEVESRFKQRLAVTEDMSPLSKARTTASFGLVGAAFHGALDAAYHELRFQKFRAIPYVRPAEGDWAKLRPLSIGKKEEEILNWNLTLQIYMGAWAQREGLVLFAGVPYRRLPENKHAIQICEMMVTDTMKVPISLPDLVRRDLLKPGLDPEMYVAARDNGSFVEKACETYINMNMAEFPHVIPSDKHFSFRNGVLQVAKEKSGEPFIRFCRIGELSDTVVCRVHHDYDFVPDHVKKPLMPQLDFLDRLAKEGISDEGKDGLHERFLAWLTAEVTEEQRAFMVLETTAADKKYLTSDISVCYKVWAAQGFSAQAIIAIAAMMGRDFYHSSVDNWQQAKFIHGESRAGKNLSITDPVEQALGSDSVGGIQAERIDTFALAGAEEWRLLHVSEVRKGDQLPEGPFLKMIAAEDVMIRKFNQKPEKRKCHFHVMFSSNEDKLPVRSAKGEFINRLFPIRFRKSFANCIDTTLAKKRHAEIGAIMAFCVRCYIMLRTALGRYSIQQFMPVDIKEAALAGRWAHNIIYEFLTGGDVIIDHGRDHRTAATRVEDFKTRREYRENADKITIMDLGVAFNLWKNITHSANRTAWNPDNYKPVFKELGLPFHTEGQQGEIYPCEIVDQGGLMSNSSGAIFPHAAMIHCVRISEDLQKRVLMQQKQPTVDGGAIDLTAGKRKRTD